MSYPLTLLNPGMTAADLAEANPTLAQFQVAYEKDTGKMKLGPGVYNDLGYLNTSGQSAETVASIGALINGAAAATLADADLVPVVQSSVTKKTTFTAIKAFLKTYFDTLYEPVGVPTILSAVLQADFPKINNTLEDVPALTIEGLVVGHIYKIEFNGISFSGDVGGGKVGFDGGSVVGTVSGFAGVCQEQGSPFNGAEIPTLAQTFDGTSNGGNSFFDAKFVIEVSTGGDLIVQYAQTNTNAVASSLLKYTAISATDITPAA